MVRPENQMPPECFYDDKEAAKYTNCTRIIKIQAEMTERCLQLIGIDKEQEKKNLFILDLGCGSGLSGEIIQDNGHLWWGLDISPSMLAIAKQREDQEGDLLESDLGHGFNFKAGFFDAIISVSALQWLCNSDKKVNNPWKRLLSFFSSVQKCLKAGGKAAIQFYPENNEQLEMITNASIKSGLAGGIYIDYPNSAKAKKYYLILSTAVQGKLGVIMTDGKVEEEKCEQVKKYKKNKKIRKDGKFEFKSRYWIYQKKERQRKQGKQVRGDTKYTGRKRKRDSNVGKSCLMMQFVERKFKNFIDPTIGVEFGSQKIKLGNENIKLQIWDTAGQENFKSITRSYFRGAIGALIVFDLTNKKSFQNVEKWLKEVRTNTSTNIQKILIGNKVDLKEERQVSTEEAMYFASQNDITYLEVSAKNYQKVDEAFQTPAIEILNKINQKEIDPKNEFGIKVGGQENIYARPQRLENSNCC